MRTKEVFLAYTQGGNHSDVLGKEPILMAIYSKSSYQKAYNWIADIAERHGNACHNQGLGYPVTSEGNVVVMTQNPKNGQRWWISRHEVL